MKQEIDLLAPPHPGLVPGVRVRILQPTFTWQENLTGLTGTVVNVGANGLVYVDLKEHNHNVLNGFKPEHLHIVPDAPGAALRRGA